LGELAIRKHLDKVKDNEWVKKNLLVFSEGEYEQDENGKWYLKPDEEKTNKTADFLEKYLGDGFEVKSVGYSSSWSGSKDSSKLDVKFDPESKKVSYQFPAAGTDWHGDIL